MTTPTPDRITPEEFRKSFQALSERLDLLEDALETDIAAIHTSISTLRDGLAAAASQPLVSGQLAPGAQGQYVDFETTSITMSIDDAGQPVYKARGAQYQKFGIRIWPEALKDLGLTPGQLHPGQNVIVLKVRALMGETGPRKIIGLAK